MNTTKENQVTLSSEEYESLLQDRKTLYALHAAGVDNWEGYEMALDELESED